MAHNIHLSPAPGAPGVEPTPMPPGEPSPTPPSPVPSPSEVPAPPEIAPSIPGDDIPGRWTPMMNYE